MAKSEKKLKAGWWKEYPDPTPIEIPSELKKPETMDDKIKRIVAGKISQKAHDQGLETFEEANDFDVDEAFEDDNILSGYEVQEMQTEFPQEHGSPVDAEKPEVQKDVNPDEPPTADLEDVGSGDSLQPMSSEPHQTKSGEKI